MAVLYKILDRKIVAENNVNEFYESAFQELVNIENDLYIVDSTEYSSMEIDTESDLKVAELLVLNNLSQK